MNGPRVLVGPQTDGPKLMINLTLRGNAAAALINAAMARQQRPVDLLADAIEAICRDNLFAAVIDA